MRLLALIFIVIPLSEMLLLFAVSDLIGAWATLGLVLTTAVIGIQVLKPQGLATLFRVNQRLQSQELPALEIVEGMLLAAAGALLLTPGFITDTIGFLLLTAPTRRSIARRLLSSGMMKAAGFGSAGVYTQWRTADPANGGGTVVEGEYSHDSQNLPPKYSSNDNMR